MNQQVRQDTGRVVVPAGAAAKGRPVDTKGFAWNLLSWFGIIAIVVGIFDIVLAWIPFNAGNPAWEFGIINLTVWSLPFASTGLVLLMAAGIALDSRWRVRTSAIAMLVLATFLVCALVLYGLAIPIALRGAPAEIGLNVRKSILKTVVLGITFMTFYIAVAVAALRQRRA